MKHLKLLGWLGVIGFAPYFIASAPPELKLFKLFFFFFWIGNIRKKRSTTPKTETNRASD